MESRQTLVASQRATNNDGSISLSPSREIVCDLLGGNVGAGAEAHWPLSLSFYTCNQSPSAMG